MKTAPARKATERCVAEEGDVYDALTDKYLAIGCSCISPNDQRLQLLSQMVEEYQADGVIDVILPGLPYLCRGIAGD
ncbi:2-hydroxyglutaryl-CoA dehydratase subunit D [Klebsiella aerogenes]|nr:2-hydroxyglutaryl-CoA dehydratase subunit D [Klebsiella aerogenes]